MSIGVEVEVTNIGKPVPPILRGLTNVETVKLSDRNWMANTTKRALVRHYVEGEGGALVRGHREAVIVIRLDGDQFMRIYCHDKSAVEKMLEYHAIKENEVVWWYKEAEGLAS